MQTSGLRPLRVGEILDVAIKIYLRNALALFKVVAVVVIPVQIVSAGILASMTPEGRVFVDPSFAPEPGSTELQTEDLRLFLAGIALLVVVGVLGSLLATAASYKAVGDAYLGTAPSWRTSVGFGFRRLLPLLWVSTLTILSLVLLAAGLILPGIVADSSALVVTGVLAWVPLVVWLFVSWSVTVPALLTEEVKGRRALARSFVLVRRRWWPTFGVLLLGYVIYVILSGVISGLFTAVLFTDAGDSVAISIVVNSLGSAMGSIITTPFLAAIITVVYFDLRVRKEGFDLQLLARHIGVEPPSGASPLMPAVPERPVGSGADPPFWPPPPGWKPPPTQEPRS